MDKSSILLLSLFLMLLILPLFPTFVFGGVTNSTYNFFNVTNITSFNWTTSNITIGSFNDSIQMKIHNDTTYISDDYHQKTRATAGNYGGNWYICFPSLGTKNITFLVQNQTGHYTSFTDANLTIDESEEFILSIHPFCPPGKYSGWFNVTRVGNVSDVVSVNTTIDIPISLNNTFNMTDNTAYFLGRMDVNDSYHSYYFNTSELTENITGLTLTLDQMTDDVDLFLFDNNGNLMGQSIEKSTGKENIIDLDLPTSSAMWEIRVYGNVSSNSNYRGYLYFSTLNITSSSNTDQTVTSIDFGDLDPNTVVTNNFTLKNEDDRVLSDVNESFEIYHVDTWSSQNTSKDFTNFLVPNFTQKIKVIINWTVEVNKSVTNWDLYLVDPSGNMIGNSTDKFTNTNTTNGTREEFVEYTGPFDEKEGLWNISVRNHTNSSTPWSYYNLTAYIWVNTTKWITTNYTDGFDFNSSGLANDTFNVSVNLTIPEREVLDGRYEGFLVYNSSEGWNTKLPISFNVSAGILVINNTLNTGTVRVTDNIGFNRLGANALYVNITFNNTGSYPIYYTNSTSNDTLTLSSTSNISFSVDGWPYNPINPGSSGTINITIPIDMTLTNNVSGIYRGWIFFNTTNTTLNSSSYPYKTFNLSLEVNLTNKLVLKIWDLDTESGTDDWIENTSVRENITLTVNVTLINGTRLSDPDDTSVINNLYVENFTRAWLRETNVTSTTYTLTNITQKSDTNDQLFCEGVLCYLNATTPTSMIGGWYEVFLGVEWNDKNLFGNGSYRSLVVNDTGLYLTALNTGTITMDEGGNYTYFNVSVINYGPLKPSGTLTFSNSSDCFSSITTSTSYTNCSASRSGQTYTFLTTGTNQIGGNGTTTCEFAWKITTGSVSQNEQCSFQIVASDTNFNDDDITGTVSVRNVSTTGDTTTTDGTTGGTTGTTTVAAKYLNISSYPSTISIEQGGNKTERVTVKNINNSYIQDVTLTILYIDSTWYSIDPSTNVTIRPNKDYNYTVNFSIPENASVEDYAGKFKATSDLGSVTEEFTLKVTPGAELQAEIVVNISKYKTDLESLEDEINLKKNQSYNVTEAENLFNQLKEKIDEASDYVDAGDYRSAYDLLDDIEDLFTQVRNSLSEAQIITEEAAVDWLKWSKWVIVGVVIVAIAVLGYMFWPTPEGIKPKGYVREVKEKKNIISEQFEKLKEKWRKIREKKKQQEYVYIGRRR